MDITVTLTSTQERALAYVALDPLEYVTAGIQVAIQRAMDEIVNLEVQRRLAAGQTIPGSREDIIAQAFEAGWIKTAAQRQAQANESVEIARSQGAQS